MLCTPARFSLRLCPTVQQALLSEEPSNEDFANNIVPSGSTASPSAGRLCNVKRTLRYDVAQQLQAAIYMVQSDIIVCCTAHA